MLQEAVEKADAAIHCRTIAWEAMEQAKKVLEIVEEARKQALEANEAALSYLKAKPPVVEEEAENALPLASPMPPPPPTPPPPSVLNLISFI